MTSHARKLFAAFALATLNILTSTAHAQGTAFTYNGRLNVSGVPATGNFDLSFTLCDAATGGNVIGAVTNTATAVTNGLFTATLDFGGVFTGTNYWLQIAAQTNNGTGFATLSPRQQIMPTPYAIYSANAGYAASANSAATAAVAGSANSVSSVNIYGTISPAQLPGVVVTNNEGGVTLKGTFSGNGGGLTNLNSSQLTGTISQSLLPAIVLTNASADLVIDGTNAIAPLTVPPKVPAGAIGSIATGGSPYFVAVADHYCGHGQSSQFTGCGGTLCLCGERGGQRLADL
jgi:hypothetical protein